VSELSLALAADEADAIAALDSVLASSVPEVAAAAE